MWCYKFIVQFHTSFCVIFPFFLQDIPGHEICNTFPDVIEYSRYCSRHWNIKQVKLGWSILLRNCVCLFVSIVVFRNSCWFMSSGAPRFGVVPVLCNREVWQSSDMTYPAVNDPNITSGFTFNKRSVSLVSELRSFVVLRPSPEQSALSAARYNTVL